MTVVADLHMHSTYSDGVLKPEELCRQAALKGLTHISITDHDNVEFYIKDRFTSLTQQFAIGIIPGVELSCLHKDRPMHLLGYGFSLQDKSLATVLGQQQQHRLERVRLILDKLNSLGVPLTLEELEDADGATTYGRPHVARAMMRGGYVGSVDEAFARYLGRGKPAYVPAAQLKLIDAIELVRNAGGVAALAHPGLYYGDVEQAAELLDLGLQAIEVSHPAHSRTVTRQWRQFCQQHGLVMAGGSDFHGDDKPPRSIGQHGLNGVELESLKALFNG